MNNITEPLRLSTGSHHAGSGRGCAMNIISWENGDTVITDMPDCADRYLSRLAQMYNDNICNHTGSSLLCAECSIKALDMAHRTVGTAGIADKQIYVELAENAATAWGTAIAIAKATDDDVCATACAVACAAAYDTDPVAYIETIEHYFNMWFQLTGHTPDQTEYDYTDTYQKMMFR